MEAAMGEGRLERVRLRRGGEVFEEPCDFAAVGYGLVGNVELAALLGTLRYAVRRGDETLATGFTRLGAVDTEGRAKRLPDDVRAKFVAAIESDPHGTRASRVQTGA